MLAGSGTVELQAVISSWTLLLGLMHAARKKKGWLCWTTCILGGGSWLGRDWFRASKMMTGAPECFSDQPPPLKGAERRGDRVV